jgi:hypothetical protein
MLAKLRRRGATPLAGTPRPAADGRCNRIHEFTGSGKVFGLDSRLETAGWISTPWRRRRTVSTRPASIHVLGPYRPAERRHVETGYRELDLPFRSTEAEAKPGAASGRAGVAAARRALRAATVAGANRLQSTVQR